MTYVIHMYDVCHTKNCFKLDFEMPPRALETEIPFPEKQKLSGVLDGNRQRRKRAEKGEAGMGSAKISVERRRATFVAA